MISGTRKARGRRCRTALLVMLLLAAAPAAAAQSEVGFIASSGGDAEVGRAAAWEPAAVGAAVAAGNELRTGRRGRLRIVFRDESVLVIGEETRVVIEEQQFDPDQGLFRTAIRLVQGRAKALVSSYYGQEGAVYEIETAVAVASVRGTEFVITFDPVGEVTNVVGVSGSVAVHSVMDRARRGVFVTAHEVTAVARGQFPFPPRRLDDTTFRQYLDGFEFLSAGRPESLTVSQPLLSSAAVPPEDRAAAVPLPAGGAPGGPAVAPVPAPAVDTGPESRTVPDVLDQPPDPVSTAGKLGVRF